MTKINWVRSINVSRILNMIDVVRLGGMKGSKVKLPIQSEFLSQLRPVHIAGGSKSLFIVSQEGKVSLLLC